MSAVIPLTLPDELAAEIRSTAKATDLSQQDVMRQSIRAGLPKVREQFLATTGLKPFTKAEAKAAFGPDPEWEKVESAMARRIVSQPEAD